MKTKDIIILIISFTLLVGSGYYVYKMLFPTPVVQQTQGEDQIVKFSKDIDTATLEKLNAYKDYGQASLDNIGRVNPFGPLN